jgi:hypothetical protein
MSKRMSAGLCFVATACIAIAANEELLLTTVTMPKDPPFGRAPKVEGVVMLVFALPASAA